MIERWVQDRKYRRKGDALSTRVDFQRSDRPIHLIQFRNGSIGTS